MTLTPLTTEHARDAARLHIAGQPGTFLTSLGAEVLTIFYRALPASPVGFGYALLDSSKGAAHFGSAPHLSASPLVGFVSATTSTGQLFAELGTRHLRHFLPALLRRFVQQPALISASVQTVLYPLLQCNQQKASGRHAELLSIMVEPVQRGQGIGGQLMTALLAECGQRQINWLEVTVDTSNDGAQRFYRRYAFQPTHEFHLFGRKMYSYRRAIG